MLRNQPFLIHDNEDLSNAIERNKDYWEADILDYLRDNFNRQEVILDIGANIGNHSVYFARYLDYHKIFCFEPDPINYALLYKNIHAADHKDYLSIRPYNFAISNVEPCTEIHLALNRSNWGAHEIQKTGIAIYAYPLDYFAFIDPVTLIKLDVEWHEPQVLESGKNLIQKDKPLILIEDADKTYESLLPNYSLIKAWDHHKTYLYKWRE